MPQVGQGRQGRHLERPWGYWIRAERRKGPARSSTCPVASCRPSTVPTTRKKRHARPAHDGALAIPRCSGEPPPRRRTSAREQERNKPRPTGPHWTNQTHRYRAPNAAARAQQHGTEPWSPVRDEEASGSNPVTPTTLAQATARRRRSWLQSGAARRNKEVADGRPLKFNAQAPAERCVLFAPNGGPQMSSDAGRDVSARSARLGTTFPAGRGRPRHRPRQGKRSGVGLPQPCTWR